MRCGLVNVCLFSIILRSGQQPEQLNDHHRDRGMYRIRGKTAAYHSDESRWLVVMANKMAFKWLINSFNGDSSLPYFLPSVLWICERCTAQTGVTHIPENAPSLISLSDAAYADGGTVFSNAIVMICNIYSTRVCAPVLEPQRWDNIYLAISATYIFAMQDFSNGNVPCAHCCREMLNLSAHYDQLKLNVKEAILCMCCMLCAVL